MKIGIFDCEILPPELEEIEGSFGRRIDRLLRSADPDFETSTCVIPEREFPISLEACDGYICSGSKYSVYDEIDWILELKDFVAEIIASETPYVGICFGHHMLAEVTGGKVERSDKGWGLGVHEFEVLVDFEWMSPKAPCYQMVTSHQDQIVEIPERAQIWARSAHCEIAGLAIGERLLGIQAHPELSTEYAQALLQKRKDLYAPEIFDTARASFSKTPDQHLAARWIADFFKGHDDSKLGI